MTEDQIEQFAIARLSELGYAYQHGPGIAHDGEHPERTSYEQVLLMERLRAAVRASDTVCRQGGDEFVVLLPGLDGVEPACLVARKILAACDAAFELAGNPVRVGVSGGIALFPQHGSTFDELSRHADGAMYAAKRGGRMRFMLYRGPDLDPEPVLPKAAIAS